MQAMPWQIITKAFSDTFGTSQGGLVKTAFDMLMGLMGLDPNGQRTPAHQRAAFTIAFISLAAKMAKSDGRVVLSEAEIFKRLIIIDPNEIENAHRVFALASEDSAGFESYARQIARALAGEPRLLRDVFDGLFHIAAADGILHAGEDAFLHTVAEIFSIAPGEFRSIRAAFVHDPGRLSCDSPYEVLGLDHKASDAEAKARHRELVREHHPDSLLARGVPPEFHAAAGRKLAVINAAYDVILRERGLKVAARAVSEAR
jgi:DnaJ like chaperone protein